jgi:hypothetical protein
LGRAQLSIVDKDADHIALVSQSELLLLQDSIWSAHATATLLAATPPTDSESSSFDPWEALHQRLLLYGRFAVTWLPNTEVPPLLTQASLMRPKLHRHSSGIYVVVSPNTRTESSDWYTVSQEERSIFWKVIVLVILSKKVYMYMCPIQNSFQV